jgi:hypothetical protein
VGKPISESSISSINENRDVGLIRGRELGPEGHMVTKRKDSGT